MNEGYPEFRYRLGKHEIRELIQSSEDRLGIVRTFSIEPSVGIQFRLMPDEKASLSSSVGEIDDQGNLKLTAEQARSFKITITEKEPALAPTEGGTSK